MNLILENTKGYKLLSEYKGDNPYIINLKNAVYVYKNKQLNSFEIQYIIDNFTFEPKFLNKMVKIASWYGNKLQEELNLDFLPKKIVLGYIIGETKSFYHVYFQYRKSQDKMLLKLIPKTAILTPLFVEDFTKKIIDFAPYNKKSGLILKPYQEMAVKFLTTRKKGILALDMGLGKTLSAIVAALEDKYAKILVVCPASLKTNWEKEISSLVDNDKISIVEGKKWDEKQWTIINYDILDNFYTVPTEIKKVKTKYIKKDGSVGWKYEEKEVKSKDSKVITEILKESQLFQGQYDLIIVDECHRLSNKTSGRYQIIYDLIEKSHPKGLYLLTGTIMANNPTNYYNILKLIDADVTKDWVSYVKTYCGAKQIYQKGERDKISSIFITQKKKKIWYDLTDAEKAELNMLLDANCRKIWIMGEPSNLEELQERTKHLYFRLTNDAIQKEIKKTVHIIDYKLNPNERINYNSAWQDYVIKMQELGKEPKIDTKQLIEASVLRQLTSSMMIPHTIELVKSKISQGDKVIVFCNFDKEVEMLFDEFGEQSVIYNGKMTIKAKDKALDKFKTDPNCMVFIGNIDSAGVGLNMTNSHIVIFNSVSWVPANNAQCECRVLRLGQTKDCEIYYQKFLNTYQEHIFETLELKNKTINAVIVSEDEK